MDRKVIMILADGMRPDSIPLCGDSFLEELAGDSLFSFRARTVFPSVTLPCHASLFLGVDPTRHGILDNRWKETQYSAAGLFDLLHRAGKRTAMLYNWEELRDLGRPGSLDWSSLRNTLGNLENVMADELEHTAMAVELMDKGYDFIFLYLGSPDKVGHEVGWMSGDYLDAVAHASRCVAQVQKAMPENYQLVVLADHGGHENSHGEDIPEDMLIPLLFHGSLFPRGQEAKSISILDIPPTIAAALGVDAPKEWEGKSLL